MRCAASCLAVGSVILGWLALAAAAVPARAKADATDAPAKTDAADAPAKTDAPAAKVDQAPADADVAKPAPARKRPLSPASIALRDRVRQTLDHYFHQQVNTGENTPAEILAFCLAFGCDAEVRYGNGAGSAINAIGCLCYGYPCAGYQLLIVDDQERVMARVGYGLQGHPGEMLSVLAQAAVPANYEVRTGKFRGTVADLVESEKRTCRGGDELAHKLSGMAFYARNGETWKNALGEEWSVERLLAEEIKRSPAVDGPDVTEQLMALSFAIERRTRAAKPLDGPYGQAQKYVAQFRDHAFKLQNADGSWHPGFFAFKGSGRDVPGQLRSTGHILQWLVYSLPEDRLDDPKVVKSVTCVTGLLTDSYSRWNATATTPREIDSVAHALHALRIYDRRAFRPLDPVAPAAEKAAPGEAKTSRAAQRVPGSR